MNCKILHIVVFLTGLIGCNQNPMSSDKYVQYWNDLDDTSDFVKSKSIEEYNYSAKPLPLDYLISNEFKGINLTQKQFDSAKNQYSGMEYYELKLSVTDFNNETIKYLINSEAEYQDRLKYVSFNMENHLSLNVEGKSAACKLYHAERTYGIAPYLKVMFAFSKEDFNENASERTLVFDDNLFNKGRVKFHWNNDDLIDVPQLSIL